MPLFQLIRGSPRGWRVNAWLLFCFCVAVCEFFSPAVSGHTLYRLSRSERNGPENHEMLGFQKMLRQFKSLLKTVDAFALGEVAAGERSQTQESSNQTMWRAEDPALQDQQAVDLLVIMKKFKDSMQKVLLYDAVCISKEARRRLAAIAALRSKKNRAKHNQPDPAFFSMLATSFVPNVGETPVSKAPSSGEAAPVTATSFRDISELEPLESIPEKAALDQHLTLPGYPIHFTMGKGIAKHFQKRQGSKNSVSFPGLSDAPVEILPGFSPSALQSSELESMAHSLVKKALSTSAVIMQDEEPESPC
ncbi:uncharacterized protein LOC121321917 isoform X2 [Polyodon spathula]|uniref:uncharacterized protein LOC121321917 isoform X2 n=1 Tax=Polyodon spathula TaxID=7913 RepID=UPI001B7DF56B|nr:uncharacterized protein LOC121321917 isoform X2 [Polyodon spathula]